MDVVSFAGILWAKSRLLVGVVLAYSLIGTLLTVLMGRRLVRLNYDQLRYEADFRWRAPYMCEITPNRLPSTAGKGRKWNVFAVASGRYCGIITC